MLHLAAVLAGVLLVLGLVDYGLRYSRFEAMLRTTPQEQREDQRTMEGDVAARAQRRRIARAWRGDSPELLAGASLRPDRTRRPDPGPLGRSSAATGRDPDRGRRPPAYACGSSAETAKIPHVEAAGLAHDWPRHPAGGLPSPPSRSPSSPRSGRPGCELSGKSGRIPSRRRAARGRNLRAPPRSRSVAVIRAPIWPFASVPRSAVSLWTPPPIGGIVPPARHNRHLSLDEIVQTTANPGSEFRDQ